MTPFDVLGLPPNTPIAEVKKHFRKLSMEKHPDKGGNEDEYKELLSAYNKIACGYKVPEKKKRVWKKPNNTITYANVNIALDAAARGCNINVPVGNRTMVVFVPSGAFHGQHIQYEGMGLPDKHGVNGILDVLVSITPPNGFTFESYMGKIALVYNVKFNRDSIPPKLHIELLGKKKAITLPKRIRDGMFLRVPNFGYPQGEPLFIKIGLI